MDTQVASLSWLLKTVLQWTLECMYHFESVFLFSLGKYPGTKLLDLLPVLLSIFLDHIHNVSIVAAPISNPTNSAQSFPFLHISWTLVTCCLFDDSPSDRCEVISHCSFGLHLSDDWWCWACIHMSAGHLCVFFGKMCIHVLCSVLNGLFGFSVLTCMSSVYILDIILLSDVVNQVYHFIMYMFLTTSLTMQKLFSLMWSNLFIFAFVSLAWRNISKIILLRPMPMLSSGSFMISRRTFKPLIHFVFIFVYDVRKQSSWVLYM